MLALLEVGVLVDTTLLLTVDVLLSRLFCGFRMDGAMVFLPRATVLRLFLSLFLMGILLVLSARLVAIECLVLAGFEGFLTTTSVTGRTVLVFPRVDGVLQKVVKGLLQQ